jgi:hypothetical protein
VKNIRAYFAALILNLIVGIRLYVARIAERVPVNIDSTTASLSRTAEKLDRAVRQQTLIMQREAAVQEASYDREDAAIAAASRAERVRNRISALLA